MGDESSKAKTYFNDDVFTSHWYFFREDGWYEEKKEKSKSAFNFPVCNVDIQ